MENSTESINRQNKIDWHQVSKKNILIAKCLILLFLLLIVSTFTYQQHFFPYTIYLIGIEVAITFMGCFMVIRMNTFKNKSPLSLPEHFKPKDEQSKLLWINLTYDISKYEEGSSYYFNGVRAYKYSTIILSGLITIVLGLDLGKINVGFLDYPTLAKNIALVLGAIVTSYSALMTYWNIEKYWFLNKTIVNKLRALRDELEDYISTNKFDPAEIQKKVVKYNEIKETFNKYWEGALSERGTQGGQETGKS
jgi:hypothetical protein